VAESTPSRDRRSCVSVERRGKTIPTGKEAAMTGGGGSRPLDEPGHGVTVVLHAGRPLRVAAWRGLRVRLRGDGGQRTLRANWPSSFRTSGCRDHGRPRSLYSQRWERAPRKNGGVRLGQARRTRLRHASLADRRGSATSRALVARESGEREQKCVREGTWSEAGGPRRKPDKPRSWFKLAERCVRVRHGVGRVSPGRRLSIASRSKAVVRGRMSTGRPRARAT
jgi:hypothetical protein